MKKFDVPTKHKQPELGAQVGIYSEVVYRLCSIFSEWAMTSKNAQFPLISTCKLPGR